ncbi:hypothetical protein BG005_007424 [Podila minutissima]|nr:hypothetical protein BG005_007424 [Podila minutissima]
MGDLNAQLREVYSDMAKGNVNKDRLIIRDILNKCYASTDSVADLEEHFQSDELAKILDIPDPSGVPEPKPKLDPESKPNLQA